MKQQQSAPILHRRADQGTWISWLASPTRFIFTGAETDDAYCLSLGTSQIGGEAKPHLHDFEEGFYLLRGSLTFVAGNQTHQLQQGDFINIGANVRHAISNESGALAEVLTLCAPAGFDRFQIEGGYPMDGPDGPIIPMSEEVIARLHTSARKHGINMNPPAEDYEIEPRANVTRSDLTDSHELSLINFPDTAGRYCLTKVQLPPNSIQQITSPLAAKALYVISGTLLIKTSTGEFTANTGDCIHFPAQTLLSYENSTSVPAEILHLHLP